MKTYTVQWLAYLGVTVEAEGPDEAVAQAGKVLEESESAAAGARIVWSTEEDKTPEVWIEEE